MKVLGKCKMKCNAIFLSEWDCVSFQVSSNRLACANHGPASLYIDIVELDTAEIWKYDQTIRITLHAQNIQKKIMVLTFHSNLFIYNMYIIKIPDYFYPTKWRYISYHLSNLKLLWEYLYYQSCK